MITAGIIGGSGYTAGELLRILLNHKKVSIDFVYSTTRADKPLSSAHADLLGETQLSFTNTVNPEVDVLFLCLGHGRSTAFLEANNFSKNTKIIDLGNDFRLTQDRVFQGKEFVYGLTELNKDTIKTAQHIANPGCFATAVQLALLPLAKAGWLEGDVHINATTGSTGAGVMPGATTHFSWRDNNFSSYKVFDHQHLGEIEQSVNQLQANFGNKLYFVPNRGNFSKGIYATAYTKVDKPEAALIKLYQEFYKDAPFTFVSTEAINLKQVINTNKCILKVEKKGAMVFITSVIDNLVKGASGQAIQNMNLLFGFEETEGLKLKGSAF